MNLVQLKDPVPHMCLADAVIASWSLTQEVAGSSRFTIMTNILENIWEKLRCSDPFNGSSKMYPKIFPVTAVLYLEYFFSL